MSKKSTITNLLVVPIIASAVFLASPAFAATQDKTAPSEVRNITGKGSIPKTKQAIIGSVTSINGNIVVVTTKKNAEYTVDAAHATIMKKQEIGDENPSIVTIGDIKVGDAIMVRGKISDNEIDATKIFDGKITAKHWKNFKHHLNTKKS